MARTLLVGSFVAADESPAVFCGSEFGCFRADGFVGRVSASVSVVLGVPGVAVVSAGGVAPLDVVSESPVTVSVVFFGVGLEFEGDPAEFSDDESDADDEDESAPSAHAVPQPIPVITAVPIPNAKASVPIRPTYVAALMLDRSFRGAPDTH